MSDADQTILSSSGTGGVSGAPQQPEKKRNPLLIIGGIGCALLLCAGLLIGGGLFLAGDQISELTSGISGQEEPTVAPSPTDAPTTAPTATPEPPEEDTPEAEAAAVETGSPESEPTEVIGPPEIGSITFALGATEDYEPIDPGTSFEGEVTEIHAIFEYSGMSPDFTWERVWYLDGDEVLRSAEVWSGAGAGVFDYFINAGGEALSPGKWLLELYVEDELLASGNFTIEGEAASPTPAATETPEPEAAAPTETPTPTPKPVTAPPASASSSGGTFSLAYTKWDGGQHLLYVADTNGDDEHFILNRAAGPSWTPDGGLIFFFGEAGVGVQRAPDGRDFEMINGFEGIGISDGIVAVDVSPLPDSIEHTQLFQALDWKQGTARWANVSPDGDMVAYDAKPGGNYRIYFLGTADNQQFNFEIIGEQADWSPDSQKLVYRSGRDGQTGIWISNRDDSGHTLITNGNDSFPTWSLDGKTIAFAREADGDVNIYTANIDGTNIQQITDTPGPDTLPVYTPGGQIIFRSARSGSWGIWKMNGDGSNQQEIIPNAGVGPDWAYSKMSVLR